MNVLSHFLEGGQHEIPAKMKVNPFNPIHLDKEFNYSFPKTRNSIGCGYHKQMYQHNRASFTTKSYVFVAYEDELLAPGASWNSSVPLNN